MAFSDAMSMVAKRPCSWLEAEREENKWSIVLKHIHSNYDIQIWSVRVRVRPPSGYSHDFSKKRSKKLKEKFGRKGCISGR
jgi:hypothetical protein